MVSNTVLGLSLVLVVGASPALADIVPISISRQVTAGALINSIFGGSETFNVSDTSSDFGLYDVTRSGSTLNTSGSAQQNSDVFSDAITIDMNAASTLIGIDMPGNSAESSASSSFSLAFTVDALTQVLISGTASINLQSNLATPLGNGGIGRGRQSVSLTGPGVDFEPSIPVLDESFLNAL
jgi:hypothetical protein